MSFLHQNTNQSRIHDLPNPQSVLSNKSQIFQPKFDQMSDSSNDIQTPNFNDFQPQFGAQNTFDSYHQNFNEKSNQLNKLISTFEGLGIQVQYLQDSDGECEQNSRQQYNQPTNLRKISSFSDDELNLARPPILTVSKASSGKLSTRQRQILQSIKGNIRNMKSLLSSILQFLYSFQKQCKNIFISAQGYYSTFLSKFMQSWQGIISRRYEGMLSIGQYSSLKRDNSELQKGMNIRQQKIRQLIKQRDDLIQQNEKLHNFLKDYENSHKNCIEYKQQNLTINKNYNLLQIKNRQLEIYINELIQKLDIIQWQKKNIQSKYQINIKQGKLYRYQLQKKYQKMFYQTISQLKHKIQTQTYYKIKYQYPFKEQIYSYSTSSNCLDQIEEDKIIKYSSQFQNGINKEREKQKLFDNYRPDSMKLSLPANIHLNSIKTQSSTNLHENSLKYSNFSDAMIQAEQRKVQNLIRDLRRNKNSSDYHLPKYASSKTLNNNDYYRKSNIYR